MKRFCLLALMGLAASGLFAGCEDDGGGSSNNDSSDGGGSSNSVVGTWAVAPDTVTPETATEWWVFRSDGTFTYYNDAALQSAHLNGTYTQDGAHFIGPFTNPGVGDGEIEGIVSEDGASFLMDFIEFWHDPAKHNALAGVRL